MNLWTMLIYGAAAVIALNGLFTLMTAHRQQSVRKFFEEELQRREEAARQAKQSEPDAAKKSPKSKAA